MRSSRLLPAVFAVSVPLFLASFAEAQIGLGGSRASIAGSGTTTVSRVPEVVQVHVTIPGKAGSLKEAIVKLQERQQKARAILEELGAKAESITFSGPSMSTGKSQQRQQLEAMIVQRMQGMGRQVPKGLQVPKIYTVNSKLLAEWSLAGKSVEEMLIETEVLKEKLEAADVAGLKEENPESLEEAELMEEMEGMDEYSMVYGDEEQVKPGTPHFTYVARITEQERAKAMTEAFKKAQKQAQDLAKAAGVEMGPLIGLSGGSRGDTDYSGGMYDYAYRQYVQQMMAGVVEEMNHELEAVGPGPDTLKFNFNVTAVFALRTP